MRPRQNSRSVLAVDGVGAGAHPHPGHQLLAVALVGHADHLHVLDVGVGVEELLDLARVDVLAAADHHVLDPPDDVDVAVVVHHGEVAGVHPPVGVDGLGGARRRRSSSPASPSSRGCRTRRSRRARSVVAGGRVGDADLDVGVDPADGRRAVVRASRRAASASTPATSRSCRSRWSPRPCASGRRTPSSPRPGTASRPSRRCAATTGRSASKSGWAELGDEHRRHAVERRAALGLAPSRARASGRRRRTGSPSSPRASCSRGCPSPCRSSGRRAPGCTAGRPAWNPCSRATK